MLQLPNPRSVSFSLFAFLLISATCLSEDKQGVDKSPLNGKWAFDKILRGDVTPIRDAYKDETLEFKDNLMIREKDQAEYDIKYQQLKSDKAFQFESRLHPGINGTYLYEVTQEYLRLSYLLHGSVPEKFSEGIIIQFKKVEKTK